MLLNNSFLMPFCTGLLAVYAECDYAGVIMEHEVCLWVRQMRLYVAGDNAA